MNNSEVPAELLTALPSLSEKFVIDFANSLDVVDDHLSVNATRSGFFERMRDSFTGQRQRRDLETHRALASGARATLQWLTELTEDQGRSNLALTRMQLRITTIRSDLASVANFSADTREQLDKLEEGVTRRLSTIEQELKRVDLEQRANAHLGRVMDKWAAGDFAQFSLLQRLFSAMDELYWGHFGDCLRSPQSDREFCRNLHEHLSSKCVIRLKEEIRAIGTEDWLSLDVWQKLPRSSSTDGIQALGWLGDWASHDQPFAYVATQPLEQLPLDMPRIFDARRAADAMSSEFFEERVA